MLFLENVRALPFGLAELLYVISRDFSIGRIGIEGTFNWVGILAGFDRLAHVIKISISEVPFSALRFIVLKTKGICVVAAGVVGPVVVTLSWLVLLAFLTFSVVSASR